MTPQGPGWFGTLLESLDVQGAPSAVPAEFAVGACVELGRLQRLRATGPPPNGLRTLRATIQTLQRLVDTRPAIVEQALEEFGRAGLAARLEQYVDAHPEGDREDQGLALLIELDRALLVAGVGRDAWSRLSPTGRRALARVERDLRAAVRAVRAAPWSFAAWRSAIAGYCEDHGIATDHPLVEVLERTSAEVPGLIAVWELRREAARAEQKAEACEVRAARARARGRTAEALGWLRQALRTVPGRAPAVAALRDLISIAGRVVEFGPAPTGAPEFVSVHGAGIERAPIALRYGDPAATAVTLAEPADGTLLAVVEDGGRPVEGAVVALVEDREGEDQPELVFGVTDSMGVANLGRAEAFAELLGAGPRRAKVKVMLPPRDVEGA